MRLFLALILITQSVYGAAIWPNGTRLQTFQNGFLFGNGQTIDSAVSGFTFGNAAQFNGPFTLQQQSTPTSPSSGFDKLYFKSDENLYKLDSTSQEINVSSVIAGGQQQSGASFPDIRVPNQQVVRTATGVGLIETGNKNLLLNSGFEHQTYSTGWTTSGTATYSGTTTASEVLSGLKSFKAVASAQTIDLVQDTTLYAAARAGSQMFLRFAASNTAAGVTACVRKNGVKQTGSNDCLTLSTDGVTRTYELAFLANGTSNGIEIDAASTTGTLIVDDVELSTESSAFVDVAQIGPWISYTPTITATTTNPTRASVNTERAFYRINGDSLEIQYFYAQSSSAGASSGSGTYLFSIPSGFVIDTNKITNNTGGSLVLGGARVFVSSSSTWYNGSVYAASTTNLSVLIDTGATSAGSLNNSVGFAAANAVEYSFRATIPVQGLSNKVSTYSQACTTDVQCENTLSGYYDQTTTAIDQFSQTLPVVRSGANNFIKTIDITKWGLTIKPNCATSQNDLEGATFRGAVAYYKKEQSTATSLVFHTRRPTSDEFDVPFVFNCEKQGADFKAKNVITGTFKDVVTSPNAGKVALCSMKVSDTGVVTEQVGGCVTTCTNASPTVCSFNSNYWSSAPNCFSTQGAIGTGHAASLVDGESTTSVNIRFSVDVKRAFKLMCHGIKL